MIAVLEAWKEGLFHPRHWPRNILSGFVVGLVALPLAMAFAIASGARPEQGIYTGIAAGFLVSLLGGSRVQIAGPTGAFVVILSGITAKHGIEGLQIATLMAGAMLFLMGLTRLGSVIKFIPAPVVLGFTAGIGTIIWVGQWKDFFGIPIADPGRHFHEKFWHLAQNVSHLDPTTTLLGLFTLFVVILFPKIPLLRRVPGPVAGLVLATAAVSVFSLNNVATIGSAFGGIPGGLPSFHLPALSLARCLDLVGPAFAIAMLGAIESLLSATVADGMSGTKHRPNQELIGQGAANVFAPFFGGFAATGAIARTATNIRSGGTSPLAGIVHSLTLLAVLLLFAPLASRVPLAALAAILFVVAWHMSEAGHFFRMAKRAPRADVLILFATYLLTVFADLVTAVLIGVVLAVLHFLRRMASSVEMQNLTPHGHAPLGESRIQTPKGVMVYSIEGPLFFGAVESVTRVLGDLSARPRVLVIRLSHVPFMDITGIQTLEEVVHRFEKTGAPVILCEANERVLGKLKKAGLVGPAGPKYFSHFETALRHAGKNLPNPSRTRKA